MFWVICIIYFMSFGIIFVVFQWIIQVTRGVLCVCWPRSISRFAACAEKPCVCEFLGTIQRYPKSTRRSLKSHPHQHCGRLRSKLFSTWSHQGNFHRRWWCRVSSRGASWMVVECRLLEGLRGQPGFSAKWLSKNANETIVFHVLIQGMEVMKAANLGSIRHKRVGSVAWCNQNCTDNQPSDAWRCDPRKNKALNEENFRTYLHKVWVHCSSLCPCCSFWQLWYDSDIFWLWSFLLTAFSSLARPPLSRMNDRGDWEVWICSRSMPCAIHLTPVESRGGHQSWCAVLVFFHLWTYIYIYMLLPPFFRIFRMLYPLSWIIANMLTWHQNAAMACLVRCVLGRCLASHFQSVSLLVVTDRVKWPEDNCFLQNYWQP